MKKFLGIAILFCLIGTVIANDGCQASEFPGADENLDCQECVCSGDAWCCSTSWDQICVGEARNPNGCGQVCGCEQIPTTTTTTIPLTCDNSMYPTCGGPCPDSMVCKPMPLVDNDPICPPGDGDGDGDGDGKCFVAIQLARCACYDEIVEAPEYPSKAVPAIVLALAPLAAFAVYKKRN